MKINIEKQIISQATMHRNMGDPLSIEEIASIAADIQRQNIEQILNADCKNSKSQRCTRSAI